MPVKFCIPARNPSQLFVACNLLPVEHEPPCLYLQWTQLVWDQSETWKFFHIPVHVSATKGEKRINYSSFLAIVTFLYSTEFYDALWYQTAIKNNSNNFQRRETIMVYNFSGPFLHFEIKCLTNTYRLRVQGKYQDLTKIWRQPVMWLWHQSRNQQTMSYGPALGIKPAFGPG